MSILDSVLNSLSRIPDAPRATREYFRDHTLNDAFDLSSNNADHFFQSHPHIHSDWQALSGSTLAAGQLLWGIPVGLKDMAVVAGRAMRRPASVKIQGYDLNVDYILFGRSAYVLYSLGSFVGHVLFESVGMVGEAISNWSQGSLNDRNSFQIAREVTLTAGAGLMMLMGARNITRGGGNFFNAARTTFQNAGEMSLNPASATAVIASVAAAIPASGLPELEASVCMMSTSRPAGNNTSTSTPGRTLEVLASAPDDDIPVLYELPEEPPSIGDPPDRELVTVPRRDFIQGSQIPEVSFGDEVPLRRVSLSPLRILKAVVTNSLWESYVQAFGRRPWAILGRISEENENVNERGRWGVVRRGSNLAELLDWGVDATDMKTASRHEQSIGRRQVDDGRRLFEVDSLQIHRVIPEDALEHPAGFDRPDQPVVFVDWSRAVAAADGMGRLLTKGRNLFNVLPSNQAERNVVLLQQSMGREVQRFSEDAALDLEDASPGYLLTEAEWESAARGPLERITVSQSDFPAFVRGPQINGRYFQGTIPRRENFVQIVNPQTMEFGREVFTNPNHAMVQDWLRNGVLGAWRVFAGDLEQGIWSSVFDQRNVTRSVLEEPQNTFGLRGMNGNVWQWVNDWFGSYEAPTIPGETIQNPRGPLNGKSRMFRGGSWDAVDPGCLCAADRGGGTPGYCDNGIGFRFGVLPQD